MRPVHQSQTRLFQKAFFHKAQLLSPPNTITRRDFLRKAATGASVLTLSPDVLLRTFKGKQIAILGAGLAGLTAAYTLRKAGIKATVYEGSNRIGGRTYSIRDRFGKGIATDIGGEFVDEWHEDLLNLAAELGIGWYDLRKTAPELPELIQYQGVRYTLEDIGEALAPFTTSIAADVASLPEDLSYKNGDAYRHLDALSIKSYLEGKGLQGWILEFICDIFTYEYGMEAAEQTAMNMLSILNVPEGDDTPDLIGGPGSEVIKIKGGTMTISEKLAAKVKRQIRFQHVVSHLSLTPDQRYEIGFQNGEKVMADIVIVTIPFTKLREVVLDIPLQERKQRAIAELGYGNSAKLILGFDKRIWNDAGYAGSTISDLPFVSGWDSSVGQAGVTGSLTHFSGGSEASLLASSSSENAVSTMLRHLETLYPGISAAYASQYFLFPWEKNVFSRAGYSSFKVGQWSAFAGVEGEREGNVFFAGEHTSLEFQGFMNGAIQTGRLAAESILMG